MPTNVLGLLLAKASLEHDQSGPHSCVYILSIGHWQRECPLHFLLQHFIPGQRTPTANHPLHAPLPELPKWKHRVQVPQGWCGHLPLGSRGEWLAARGGREMGCHKVPQGQELALSVEQYLSI